MVSGVLDLIFQAKGPSSISEGFEGKVRRVRRQRGHDALGGVTMLHANRGTPALCASPPRSVHRTFLSTGSSVSTRFSFP